MQWTEAIQAYLSQLESVPVNAALLDRLIRLIDLTSLDPKDTDSSVVVFLKKARTPFGNVAAVCVLPQFVSICATEFANTDIHVATVANFPEANASLETVLVQINDALEDGANEIDVVFPYHRYLAGERQYAQSFVNSCKAACGDACLKVILETGVLSDLSIIADASYDALVNGADFIKTSTGKANIGATLEAAATMLLVIKHVIPQLKRPVGLKVSGGVSDIAQAAQYVELADLILGREKITADTFRIGTSKLVDEMLQHFAD